MASYEPAQHPTTRLYEISINITQQVLSSLPHLTILTPPSPRRNIQSSPFLYLPLVVRNRIFSFVFTPYACHITSIRPGESSQRLSTTIYDIAQDQPQNHVQSPSQTHFFAPLLVCRQLYRETALLPIARMTFVFTFFEELEKWGAQKLKPKQRDVIAVLKCPIDEVYRIHNFRNFKGLKKVVLGAPRDGQMAVTEDLRKKAEMRVRKASEKEGLEVVTLACGGA